MLGDIKQLKEVQSFSLTDLELPQVATGLCARHLTPGVGHKVQVIDDQQGARQQEKRDFCSPIE